MQSNSVDYNPMQASILMFKRHKMCISPLGYLDNAQPYVTRIRSNLKVSVKTLSFSGMYMFSGAFAKLRKATVCFAMSASPSVSLSFHLQQLGCFSCLPTVIISSTTYEHVIQEYHRN